MKKSNEQEKLWKIMGDLEKARILSPEEQVKLGLKYFRKGPNQNYQIAFEIFSMAAEEDYPSAIVYVARMYNEGLYVRKSVTKAVRLLKRASSLGSINAKCILGGMATRQESSETPIESALHYFTEAADLGSLYAKFCLANVYKSGIGIEKDRDKAIEHYSECVKANHVSKNMGILAESYFSLIQCYLEKHYIEEANTVRDVAYYNSTEKKNKEKAKFYLEEAKKIKDLVSPKIKESYENALEVFASILNETDVELSKMSYGEFRQKYYNKHPRIFLPTKKTEHLIYTDGIKNYFFKRDDSQEELEYSLRQRKDLLERRKIVLKKLITDLGISSSPEASLAQTTLDDLNKDLENFKTSYLTDYSTCVINLDKYLEEILHYIFVIELQNHKKDVINFQIDSQENLIVKLTNKLSIEKLKNLNSLVNGINPNTGIDKIDEEKHKQLFSSFITKMIERKTPKSISNRLNKLNEYHDECPTIDQDEIDLIKEVNELNNRVAEREKIQINPAFQLGSLFDLTFVDHGAEDDSMKLSTPNKLNEEVLDFAQIINPEMTRTEIYLKLHELILKIEHFRVMIRNVASHKSILTQNLMEKGLNLCIVQESSVFNLLDELFGQYIESKMYFNDFQKFAEKSETEFSKTDVETIIESTIETFPSNATII